MRLNKINVSRKKMKKVFILVIITILVGCGNKKTNQISDNTDEKISCKARKVMGSNIPVKTCKTVSESKEENKTES